MCRNIHCIFSDAGRVAPISACVFYLIDRLKSGFEAMERTVIPGNCALMGATRLASVFCSLVPAGKRDVYTRNKGSQTAVIIRLSVSLFLKIRDASPPLVVAFGA